MEEAVSERRKAFAAAHRSDEDHQADISVARHASSIIAKSKVDAWQVTSSKSDSKSAYFLFRSVTGSFSPNFSTVLRTMPTT